MDSQKIKKRYFIKLSYDGTNYHGWQKQANTTATVQQEVEAALIKLIRLEEGIMGCGRTDAGVHARGYVAHFDSDEIDIKHVVYKLNIMLPSDIVILDIEEVKEDLHARFHATSRSYVYHFKRKKNPFDNRFKWRYSFGEQFDLKLLAAAAELIKKYDHFDTFCKLGSDNKSTKCIIEECYWKYDERNDTYSLYITANRFLRGMIRLIVGMCVNVMRGKLTLNEVKEALDKQEKLKLNYSVPANGLCLYNIKY